MMARSRPSLIAEVDAARDEQATREREQRAQERERQLERVEKAIVYTLDQKPDKVHWENGIGAVAVVDGIVMALKYSSTVPTLAVVCICNECGQKFLSYETFGSDFNHYGPTTETPQPHRRQRAVKEIAKVMERNFQPNKWGHDHKCAHWATREIPFSLLPQVDALLRQEAHG